jgi:hypothetical protein
MTREETIDFIRQEVLTTKSLESLCERLRCLPDELVFGAFFPIAVRTQLHGPALGAASVLFVVRPACPIPCQEAIRAMLDDWDISIEEVPWYIADCFGKDTTLNTIDELNQKDLTRKQRASLSTVRYWADIYFDFTPEKARERRHIVARYF